MLSVTAHSKSAKDTISPPTGTIDLPDTRSAVAPIGRFALAIPNMMAETVTEAVIALTKYSVWIIGSTGWVI
jgi:hypothetical protein